MEYFRREIKSYREVAITMESSASRDRASLPSDELEAETNEGSDELGNSNVEMADPKSRAAVEPVPRMKREPADDDLDARVKTTHDVHGGGNPRLVLLFNDSIHLAASENSNSDSAEGSEVPKEFPLVPGVTTIGSEPDNDICLPRLKPHHAEVHRDKFDEYSIVDLSGGETSIDGGRVADGVPLHAGRRVEIGDWTLVYWRAEYADHGSPYGGHTGGEFVGYRVDQDIPRPRGASPEGGSEPTETDPGEYY